MQRATCVHALRFYPCGQSQRMRSPYDHFAQEHWLVLLLPLDIHVAGPLVIRCCHRLNRLSHGLLVS